MKITFISNYLHKNNKGQTLIEVVITLGVALIIITSILVLANASNRRATIARQSTQASKLAQEGMEIVRNIRDVDNDQAVQEGLIGLIPCTAASPCSWSDLYGDPVNTFSARLEKPSTGDCSISESWCLVSGIETVLNIFTRSITVSDDDIGGGPGEDVICAEDPPPGQPELEGTDIKRVTVTVSWESPIGDQEREVVSCLSNWR